MFFVEATLAVCAGYAAFVLIWCGTVGKLKSDKEYVAEVKSKEPNILSYTPFDKSWSST